MSKRRGVGYALVSATEKAQQRRDNQRPLVERTAVEGNIMEYPIFALSNKESKPMKPDPQGRTDEQGNLLWIPDEERYSRTYAFEVTTASGHTAYRTVMIVASTEWGFPGNLAFEVFVYLCQRLQENNFASPFVPFTFNDFAERTNRVSSGKFVSGKTILSTKNAIRTLLETELVFTDAWCRRASETEVEAAEAAAKSGKAIAVPSPKPQFLSETTVRICSGARLIKRSGSEAPAEVVGALPPILDMPGIPDGWVRLSDEVYWSFKNGYRFAIDPDYLFALKSPIAKRVYVLLTKRDDRKSEYQEDILKFARRIGLSRIKSPRDAWDQLKDAIQELATPMKNGKVFLTSPGAITERGKKGNQKIIFYFARAAPAQQADFAKKMDEYFKNRLRDDPYAKWFAPLRYSLDRDGTLEDSVIVQAPDVWHRDFVRDNYRELLDETAANVLGRPAKVVIIH